MRIACSSPRFVLLAKSMPIKAHVASAMNCDREANSIIPVKPMVYLPVPVQMKKGNAVLSSDDAALTQQAL